ncbi:MAG TPA: hypothetical protein VFA89_02680 [Terriglobales bacterium]|nr:hypothetical protein [Terriglobales bacterium]
MVRVDGQGIPLGAQLASASPAEVTLAESVGTIRAGRTEASSRAARFAGATVGWTGGKNCLP